MILSVVAIVLSGFFIYHLILIAKNITTNEKIKKGRSINYLNKVISMLEQNIYKKKIEEDKNFSGNISQEQMILFHKIVFDESKIIFD